MRSRLLVSSLVALSMLITSVSQAGVVSALTGSSWQAGNIIDDAIFTNADAMSVAQIQSWLNARLKNCDYYGSQPSELGGGTDYNGNGVVSRAEYGRSKGNPAPFTCLNKYYEVPKTQPGSKIPASNYGSSTIPTGAKSAARLIYDAAQAHNISPKVLLVKLGTESAGPLTSDVWPFKRQYQYAMGAHCPDSGPGGSANCDQNYAGFSLQMREAAALLRWYLDSMDESWWTYKSPYETNNILWNIVESGCGGKNVFIQNRATAALYTYTPYQPNAAALSNLYGTGNGCSAYGNRNFWRVYHDWFGSPHRINYDWLNEPRWMKTTANLQKYDLATTEPVGSVIPAGTELYFSSKTLADGTAYLRTRHDTLSDADRGIRMASLAEIDTAFTPMNVPRWMALQRDTLKLDPVTENFASELFDEGRVVYLTTKIEVGGQTYLRSYHDTARNADSAFLMDALAETTIPQGPMSSPRWMEPRKEIAAIDTTTGSTGATTYKPGQHIYFDHRFTINGVTFVQQDAPAVGQEYVGYPITMFKNVSTDFIDMKSPRSMELTADTKKIDTETMEEFGSLLTTGSTISFSSKIYIGDKIYLRTQHDTERNVPRAIPYDVLQNP